MVKIKTIKTVSGNIVDVLKATIYSGTLKISNGKIVKIIKENKKYSNYIIPGFIDSHIHIESSMLTPSEFARIAVTHGTVATVSDPHEIANVLGIKGVKYMTKDGKKSPLKFYFGAPPCVPATNFETNGANLGTKELEVLLKTKEIKYLSEMMNFPGVINKDPIVMEKIRLAQKYQKPIDGHAPGLSGKDLKKYVCAGISSDHESITKEEALEKLKLRMKILIREGSAVKNFDELIPIVKKHFENCMFCSDDKHPDDLLKGHINHLVIRAIKYGISPMKVLRVACVNPVLHYKLDVGLLQKGDWADFLVINDLKNLKISKTIINGEIVAENGKTLISRTPSKIINKFKTDKKNIKDFVLSYRPKTPARWPDMQQGLLGGGGTRINIIEAIDGQLITNKLTLKPKVKNGYIVSDVKRDILKIAVVNRYEDKLPAIGFIKNFGLKKGAIASSVVHDSHNIIAVGTTDKNICKAVNLIIENKGGIAVVSEDLEEILPLSIAGIISNKDYLSVAKKYTQLDKIVKSFDCQLHAPFMTLSFMALLVIPKLKLSDQGLFDYSSTL